MIIWIITCTESPKNEKGLRRFALLDSLVNPRDEWAQAAKAARKLLGEALIVTTDEVLTEFLAALRSGEHMRKQAAKMVRCIIGKPKLIQTHLLGFHAAPSPFPSPPK